MKVIIAGSRTITDYKVVCDAIAASGFYIHEVVCGEARGVDSLGRVWGTWHGRNVASFEPDWNKFGKKAGILRNQEMADYADALIAVWDGTSRGTSDMIKRMEGKPVFIYKLKGDGKYDTILCL